MSRYFISGHTDLFKSEFLLHYADALEAAVCRPESTFVVGDADGVDTYAQRYLAQRIPRERITVYHMHEKPRSNPCHLPTRGGFRHHEGKDAAMTGASDCDILWFRSEEEQMLLYGANYRKRISGTEKNFIRRRNAERAKRSTLEEARAESTPHVPGLHSMLTSKIRQSKSEQRPRSAVSIIKSFDLLPRPSDSIKPTVNSALHSTLGAAIGRSVLSESDSSSAIEGTFGTSAASVNEHEIATKAQHENCQKVSYKSIASSRLNFK